MRVVVLGCNGAGFEISLYHRVPWSRVYLVVCRFSLFPIGTISYARGCNII